MIGTPVPPGPSPAAEPPSAMASGPAAHSTSRSASGGRRSAVARADRTARAPPDAGAVPAGRPIRVPADRACAASREPGDADEDGFDAFEILLHDCPLQCRQALLLQQGSGAIGGASPRRTMSCGDASIGTTGWLTERGQRRFVVDARCLLQTHGRTGIEEAVGAAR